MTPLELVQSWHVAALENHDPLVVGVLLALESLVEAHPHWFCPDLVDNPLIMLDVAGDKATHDLARNVIAAAFCLVLSEPDWLPKPEPKPEPEYVYANDPTTGTANAVVIVPAPVVGILRGIHEQMEAGARVVFLQPISRPTGAEVEFSIMDEVSDFDYERGARDQRNADVAHLQSLQESFAAAELLRQPLVTDDAE